MAYGDRTNCKACGREIIQIGGGHRQREYCDDNCRQTGLRMRREQQHRDEVNRRWGAFLPETRNFLDWLLTHYGEGLATAVETAINREMSRSPDIAVSLLAFGKEQNFPELHFTLPDGTPAKIRAGEQAWKQFSELAEYRLVHAALASLRQSLSTR